MSVVWIIVQVLLWILAVIFGLLLLMILISAIPVRYRVRFKRKDKVKYIVRIKWLFFGFNFSNQGKDGKPMGISKEEIEKQFEKMWGDAEKESPDVPPKKKDGLFKKIAKAREVLTESQVLTIIKYGFVAFKKIYRVAKPKHIDVFGVVGFSCPFTTGLFFAGYEAVAGLFGLRDTIRLNGDFNTDETVVHLEADISGRASPLRLALPVLQFALRKPVRKQIRKLLRERRNNKMESSYASKGETIK